MHRTLQHLLTTVWVCALAACTRTVTASTHPLPDGSGHGLAATIIAVIDGDTVDVAVAGLGTERVRLLGVDTPETRKPGAPVGCWGPEASEHTKDLLPEGTEVLLQRDRQARDRYGRLLAYLWRRSDGLLVNRDLVAGGWGKTLSINPNTAHRADLAAAEHQARQSGAGLWGRCPPQPDG